MAERKFLPSAHSRSYVLTFDTFADVNGSTESTFFFFINNLLHGARSQSVVAQNPLSGIHRALSKNRYHT